MLNLICFRTTKTCGRFDISFYKYLIYQKLKLSERHFGRNFVLVYFSKVILFHLQITAKSQYNII